MIRSLRAILFDLDNTLLDREATFLAFAAQFVTHYLPRLSVERSRELIERIVQLDEDGYKKKPELFLQLRDELPFDPSVTVQELLEYYAVHYVANAVPMDGAEELLSDCRAAGLRIGLVTNGRTVIQLGKLHKLNWTERFDAIVVSEAAGCAKPDRAIFMQALIELGVSADEAVFVGDHPVNDIGGAAAAGMKAVWLRFNQPWKPGIPEPFLTINDLNELMHQLGNAPGAVL